MIGSSNASRKGCDFDTGLTNFTVTDWVISRDTYSVDATLSLARPCFNEDVLTE